MYHGSVTVLVCVKVVLVCVKVVLLCACVCVKVLEIVLLPSLIWVELYANWLEYQLLTSILVWTRLMMIHQKQKRYEEGVVNYDRGCGYLYLRLWKKR